MNRIFSKLARAISKILFILGLYNFLAYLECVKSYAWSKGHSEPDLSSVENLDLGPSTKQELFGSIKAHEVVKNGQNLVGSIKKHESQIFR